MALKGDLRAHVMIALAEVRVGWAHKDLEVATLRKEAKPVQRDRFGRDVRDTVVRGIVTWMVRVVHSVPIDASHREDQG